MARDNVLVRRKYIKDTANAIRRRAGRQDNFKPSEFADAILAIDRGGMKDITVVRNGQYMPPANVSGFNKVIVNVPQSSAVLFPKTITQRGTYTASDYNADGFSSVTVDTYPEPSGTKVISANGTNIDIKAYDKADVNVPNSYALADEGKVVSNGALVAQTSTTVTQNGTVDTTLNNEVVVSVTDPITAYHVWTRSPQGEDASMWVQEGTYEGSTFTPTGEQTRVNFNGQTDTDTDFDIFTLTSYYISAGSIYRWKATANTSVYDGSTNDFDEDDVIKDWGFSDNVDFYIIELVNEGKVVHHNELVSQTSTTVTQNGTYDTTLNDEVVVNISSGSETPVEDYAFKFTPDNNANQAVSAGFAFSLSKKIRVSKLRVWARESTASAYISWGQSIKASVVDANVVSGQWNDLELNEPIILDKDITYVVWYSMPNYACKYKNGAISSDKNYVTYQGGRYATSRKTIPTNNENTAYGVDFYIDSYLEDSDPRLDFSYLPNSVVTNVLASADYTMVKGGSVGTLSALLGVVVTTNSELTVGNNGIELPIGKMLACPIGNPNSDVTLYGVLKNYGGGRESFWMAIPYGYNTGNSPAWYSSDGTKVQKAVYGSYNPQISGVSAKDFHVYAMSLNQTTKKVRFYFDGAFNEELSFSNSGSIAAFGRGTQDSANYDDAYYFKYGGVVLGVESDATIVANMQTIMQKLGIGE